AWFRLRARLRRTSVLRVAQRVGFILGCLVWVEVSRLRTRLRRTGVLGSVYLTCSGFARRSFTRRRVLSGARLSQSSRRKSTFIFYFFGGRGLIRSGRTVPRRSRGGCLDNTRRG